MRRVPPVWHGLGLCFSADWIDLISSVSASLDFPETALLVHPVVSAFNNSPLIQIRAFKGYGRGNAKKKPAPG
jgi:hypothetical protein